MQDTGEILITGGAGFLGVAVAEALLARDAGARLTLTDLFVHPRMKALGSHARFVQADLTHAATCRALITPAVRTVFHFASLVSGGAERDFTANLHVNVYGTINVLEACRQHGTHPRVIFTSSIATYGGREMPGIVTEQTFQRPQNSYGVAKVIGEQLLNDYSRKGFVDGRGVRLPAIVVRDEPNTAASGYLSALFREPLRGHDYVCPVAEETRIPILSVKRGVETLVALSDLPGEAFGDSRTLNGPNLSPSAGEIAAAVRAWDTGGAPKGTIRFAPDTAVQAFVGTWPHGMECARAATLGLKADASLEEIIREYVQRATKA